MINTEDFTNSYKNYEANDELRENLIKSIRNFQRDSKRAISEAHKIKPTDDLTRSFKKCENILSAALKVGNDVIANLLPKNLRLRFEFCFIGAVEEYLEAWIFIEVKKKLLFSEIDENEDNTTGRERLSYQTVLNAPEHNLLKPYISLKGYLGAVSDVTGELGRYCVTLAMTVQSQPQLSKKTLKTILDLMQDIYDEYQFLYPSANEDKKIKAIETNVRKVRDLMFQMEISRPRVDVLGKHGMKKDEDEVARSVSPETKKLKI